MNRSFFSAAMFGALLVKKPDRKEFFRNIVPSVASQSMPPGSQGTFHAVTVTQQINRSKIREQQVASDVVSAVSAVAAKPAGPDKQLTAIDLNNLPALSRVAQPDLVNRINAVANAADQRAAAGGLQAVRDTTSALEKSAGKPFGSDKKLTDVEIQELPAFAAALQQTPDLHDRIAAVAVAADQRARVQAQKVASGVIAGIKAAAADPSNTLTENEVVKLPELKAVIDSGQTPNLLSEINGLAQQAELVKAAVEAIDALNTKYVTEIARAVDEGRPPLPQKLNVEDLETKAPLFNKLLTDPDLRGRVVMLVAAPP